MISIIRPTPIPQFLARRGVEQTTKDCTAYDDCPDEYRLGKKEINTFYRNIYAAPSVKAILVRIHYGKCCYCEKKFIPANLHVEHFRPKSGVRQNRKQNDQRPGYYWLAYRWDNLLLACHLCNSTYKSTLFPLANPEIRTRYTLSHHYDINKEDPLFIDPASVDPRVHIRFRGATPIALTPVGRTTIRELGLRKSSIIKEGRMKKLNELRMCRDIVELAKDDPSNPKWRELAKRARRILQLATKPNAEYCSMAQDYLENWRP